MKNYRDIAADAEALGDLAGLTGCSRSALRLAFRHLAGDVDATGAIKRAQKHGHAPGSNGSVRWIAEHCDGVCNADGGEA